jgi:hypothetical protein
VDVLYVSEQKMTSESRQFFLLSQIFFASVSAIPWILIAALSVFGFSLAPLWALFILGYGLAALFLLIRWVRFRKRDTTSNVDNMASLALWAIPFMISIGGIVMILVAQLDGKPDISFDCEYRPIDYIALPILSAIWFGIPLLYSALLTRGDWNTNEQQKR